MSPRSLSHPSLSSLVDGQYSDLETTLQQHMTWAGLPAPLPQFRFALDEQPPRQWRFDFAWPSVKLAIEIQGGTWVQGKHSRGAGQERDAQKLSTAAMLGWRVLVITERFVKTGEALRWIERALAAAKA